MSDSIQRQAQVMRVGAIAVPVLAVWLIRYAGPEQSVAAPMVEAYETPVIPSVHAATDEPESVLEAAAAYARRLFEDGIRGNPLPASGAGENRSDTPPLSDSLSPTRLTQPEPEVPELRISAVMSRRGGSIAVINSRICAVGARVAPGWTLDAVDEQGRKVVICHTGGRRVELTLSMP